MPALAPSNQQAPALIVGAGLSGLCCALRLHEAGRSALVLEASDRVGGRMTTDEQDGFLLDRGFQVLLTSYPEVRARLDAAALSLRAFRSGSAVRLEDRVAAVADPYREPWTALRSLFTPLLGVGDALRSNRLRSRLLRDGPHAGTAGDVLRSSGVSERLLDRFFRPFFRGVTLAPELDVPADYFAFLFRMFAAGEASLPARGMGAVPQQLAGQLPAGAVRLQTRVRAVADDHVVLDDGSRLDGSAVVVATAGREAAGLSSVAAPSAHRATTCLYFAVRGAPPLRERMLLLNGTGAGPILHMCCPSVVQPSYAPGGHHLVSVTLLGVPDEDPVADVRANLRAWFGPDADGWQHLRTYRLPFALPALKGGDAAMERSGVERDERGAWVCGDHLATPSIQGAMAAGRRAAEAVLEAPPAAGRAREAAPGALR